MGLLNLARLGSLLGAPPPSGGGGVPAGTELGKGSAVVGANSNTTLDCAVVADGNAIYPAFPTIRDEGVTRAVWSGSTASAPAGTAGHFNVEKVPVADLHALKVRTSSNYGTRTFDWYWFSVATS